MEMDADWKEYMDEEVLDVEGAARLLGVGPRTIYNLVKTGKLPGLKVGRAWRFHRESILKWLVQASENAALEAKIQTGDPKTLQSLLKKGQARVKTGS